MVNQLDPGVDFYTKNMGFHVKQSGGSEILVDDPSGNPVELFQPAR